MNSRLASGLHVRGEIQARTRHGRKYIQLLVGDLTKLPPEEKMDVVMVSVYPGDYRPIPGTLIGALERNLDLGTDSLANDKEEDLRTQFNCWWSKRLPRHLPFRRLLCMEAPFLHDIRHPPEPSEWIDGVFQCLVLMLGFKVKTVITPLPGTGLQGYSKIQMLRAMLDGAIHRIQAGLPLKLLRIVLYAPNTSQIAQEDRELITFFETYRKTVEGEKPEVFKEAERNPHHRQWPETPISRNRTHFREVPKSTLEAVWQRDGSADLVGKTEGDTIATSVSFRQKRITLGRAVLNKKKENDEKNPVSHKVASPTHDSGQVASMNHIGQVASMNHIGQVASMNHDAHRMLPTTVIVSQIFVAAVAILVMVTGTYHCVLGCFCFIFS